MSLKIKLEKKEIEYMFVGVVFLLLWFLYIREMIAPYLQNVYPFFAMLIFNSGMFFSLYLIFSILNGKETQLKLTILSFLLFIGMDIIAPPYLLSPQGVFATTSDYYFVSTDYGFGRLYESLGFNQTLSVPLFAFSFIGLVIGLVYVKKFVKRNKKFYYMMIVLGTIFSLFLTLLNIMVNMLWIMTYVITPILLMFVMPVLLFKSKEISRARSI